MSGFFSRMNFGLHFSDRSKTKEVPEAFVDLKVTTPKGEKVVQLVAVTTRDILELTERELNWLLYQFAYCAEPRGLACAAEAGLLDAWLRMMCLWEASKFPGVDNLTAHQARQVR